jgi:uncharacterized membrane protein YqgA involved in biofilm formation
MSNPEIETDTGNQTQEGIDVDKKVIDAMCEIMVKKVSNLQEWLAEEYYRRYTTGFANVLDVQEKISEEFIVQMSIEFKNKMKVLAVIDSELQNSKTRYYSQAWLDGLLSAHILLVILQHEVS